MAPASTGKGGGNNKSSSSIGLSGAPKKKSTVNSDVFKSKRTRGKVGKSAPKQLNVTETAFQSTTIHVSNQVSSLHHESHNETESNRNKELISSRGRTINELIQQLYHPACSVRVSACKGLYDIIQISSSNSSGIDCLIQNLSLLIVTFSKCIIDTDETVRFIGSIQCFTELFICLSSSSSIDSDTNTTRDINILLQPYGQLLIAYTNASLNSLDSTVRRSGTTLCTIFAQYIPNVISTYVLSTLLPSYVRLLSERGSISTTNTITNANTGSTTTGSNNTNGTPVVMTKVITPKKNNNVTSTTAIVIRPSGCSISNSGGVLSKAKDIMKDMSYGITNKKRKRNSNSNSNSNSNRHSESNSNSNKLGINGTTFVVDDTLLVTLQSIALLMYATYKSSNSNSNDSTITKDSGTSNISRRQRQQLMDEPDYIWKSCSIYPATNKNGIQLLMGQRQHIRTNLTPIISLNDLHQRIQDITNSSGDSAVSNPSRTVQVASIETIQTVYDMLCRIRDIILEISSQQQSSSSMTSTTVQYNTKMMEYLTPLSTLVRYFVQIYSTIIISALPSLQLLVDEKETTDNKKQRQQNNKKKNVSGISKDMNRMKSLILHVSKLILEFFPIVDTSNHNNQRQRNNNQPTETMSTTAASTATSYASTRIDEANGNFCFALLRIVVITQHCTSQQQRNDWLEIVASYVQQALEKDDVDYINNNNNDDTNVDTNMQQIIQKNRSELSTSNTLLYVFEYLLFHNSSNNNSEEMIQSGNSNDNDDFDFDNQKNTATKQNTKMNNIMIGMVDTFCSVFFKIDSLLLHKSSNTTTAVSSSLSSSSSTARYAVQIAMRMFEQNQYNIDETVQKYGSVVSGADMKGTNVVTSLQTIIATIPLCIMQYILHWKVSFPIETASCITFVHNIVRCFPSKVSSTIKQTDDQVSLLASLRLYLEKLFIEPVDVEETMNDNLHGLSIFEQLPTMIRRQIIALLVTVDDPTDVTLQYLGTYCGRHRIHELSNTSISNENTSISTVAGSYTQQNRSDSTAEEIAFIIESVHNVRKSISMKKYIGFLLDSTGLMYFRNDVNIIELFDKVPVSSLVHTNVRLQIDNGIRDLCFCILQCGATKVLPKLESIFLLFLQPRRSDPIEQQEPASVLFTLTNSDYVCLRAILTILTICAIDITNQMQMYGPNDTEDSINNHNLAFFFGLFSKNFRSIVVTAIISMLRHSISSSSNSDSNPTNKHLITTTINNNHGKSLLECDVLLRPIRTLLAYDRRLLIDVLNTLSKEIVSCCCLTSTTNSTSNDSSFSTSFQKEEEQQNQSSIVSSNFQVLSQLANDHVLVQLNYGIENDTVNATPTIRTKSTTTLFLEIAQDLHTAIKDGSYEDIAGSFLAQMELLQTIV